MSSEVTSGDSTTRRDGVAFNPAPGALACRRVAVKRADPDLGCLGCLPDEALVSCARGGKPDCFEELFERHRPRIRSYLNRLLRKKAAWYADDLEQQTFMKAWACLRQFAGRSSFRTWLATIAINEVRMEWRRKKFHDLHVLLSRQPATGKESQATGFDPSAPDDLELQIIVHELEDMLAAAVYELPSGYREVLELRLRGMKANEIAQRLGISAAAKARLHRAKQVLGARLRQRMRRCRDETVRGKSHLKKGYPRRVH